MSCSGVSIFRNQKCHCGNVLKTDGLMIHYNDFVKESATFILQDDLNVMPNDLGTSLSLLQKRGINNIADIEKKTILIGKKEARSRSSQVVLALEDPTDRLCIKEETNPL
ncbi:hypothetical protein TSUD_177640 [Trifolium subterraneum]|uniref:Uncharacterized protein n=1 Tax=Trifolium subterraneum TaxID=3900 RepID=A0A2Z6PJV9_TRISU|nr:hypothetical protein TSUD_177640 [Trifolium subterraneum]